MGYTVWTKGYGEEWHRHDCENEGEAKGVILEALKNGQDPILTQELTFELKLTFKEPKEEGKKTQESIVEIGETKLKEAAKSGAKEDRPEAHKSTGS